MRRMFSKCRHIIFRKATQANFLRGGGPRRGTELSPHYNRSRFVNGQVARVSYVTVT